MAQHFLDFERPIAELEAKINELRMVENAGDINISEELTRLQTKCVESTQHIFAKLTPWQIAQLARHPQRPHTMDYINAIFTDFDELQGDRHCSNGPEITAGIARFNGRPVLVMGHEKGCRTKEKIYRNFGMAKPESYRKALRLMHMAEKFKLPMFTFIDTSGAYPGIGAEERNQSEAIARNLLEMSQLKTPIICTVIGEGGSGGALAIGVGDKVLMLQYSVYSVISPEGCASILWKDAAKAPDAATAMGITADRLYQLGLIDQVIEEPMGGAHRDPDTTAKTLKQALQEHLTHLEKLPLDALLEQRYQRLMALGKSE